MLSQRRSAKINFSEKILASLTFLSLLNVFYEIPSHKTFVFEILLFNFQRPKRCRRLSSRDLLILPHLPAFVNTFSKISLKKFLTATRFIRRHGAFAVFRTLPSKRARIVYHFFFRLSSTFSKKVYRNFKKTVYFVFSLCYNREK